MMAVLHNVPNAELLITSGKGDASEMTKELAAKKPDRIIAIGGDGTINEVASEMMYTNIPLGIIPSGSGNGLAGHLKLPTTFKKALEKALEGEVHFMDAAFFNERPFFCTAGIGFDAAVAHHFAKSKHRGFFNYIRSTILTLLRYRNIEIGLLKNSIIQKKKLFSCTWANANQYGNNAIISPLSKIDDGIIESILINPLHFLQVFILPIQLFSGKLHDNAFVNISSVEEMVIEYHSGKPYHLDGEIFLTDSADIQVRIAKSALKVIY